MKRPVEFAFTSVRVSIAESAEIRRSLPSASGVFRIFDVHGNLILLDKAAHLAERVERFFAGDRDSRDLDLREISDRVEFCRTDSPFETLYLLHHERRRAFPASYRQMKTFPLYSLLQIDPGLRFPRIEIVRRAGSGRWTWGPFRTKAELEHLKTEMERAFRLRPCDYDIRGDDPYPDCIYFQMHTCSKPCNGDITRSGYMEDVGDAAACIEGREGDVLARTDQRIRALAGELRFEEAAALQKRVDRIIQVRDGRRHRPHRVEHFHAVVVLDSGSTRTRKIAHVRSGRIAGIEVHDIKDLARTVDEAIRSHSTAPDDADSSDQQYEDFCLVSRFMMHPVASVTVVGYTHGAGAGVGESVARTVDRSVRRKRPSNRNPAIG